MGLIRTLKNAAGGVMADQWKEYFYCNAIDEDVLLTKASKKVSGRSSNTKGGENIISTGSVIAVNEGQCMLIVDQGKVVEICSEAGEYTYDVSTEASLFVSNLDEGIEQVFKNIGKRFTFGGEAPKDQRVYFVNTKELVGNKYGTPNPIPFRVVDQNIGLDVDIAIKCFGEYSYKVTNPILFYTNVCGNVQQDYRRNQLESQLKSELLTALQPAFAKISAMGVRYSMLPAYTEEIGNLLNDILSKKWKESRGIEIVAFGISSVKASEEDEAMIKELQKNATFRNPNMAAAHLVNAQANAMQAAAANTNAGSAMAFMGMNMAANAGGMNAQNLFAMGQQSQMQIPPMQGTAQQNQQSPEGWVCSCGTVNRGKFCMECGAKKPQGAPQYQCDKCGWTPADPTNPPKFCPECGDPFDSNDLK